MKVTVPFVIIFGFCPSLLNKFQRKEGERSIFCHSEEVLSATPEFMLNLRIWGKLLRMERGMLVARGTNHVITELEFLAPFPDLQEGERAGGLSLLSVMSTWWSIHKGPSLESCGSFQTGKHMGVLRGWCLWKGHRNSAPSPYLALSIFSIWAVFFVMNPLSSK